MLILYRAFDAVDSFKTESLGMIEYESFLMGNDILGPGTIDLMLMDVYDTLKAEPKVEEFGEEIGNNTGNIMYFTVYSMRYVVCSVPYRVYSTVCGISAVCSVWYAVCGMW